MRYFKLFVFGFLLVGAVNVYAQDYVITAKGDSLPCKISISIFNGSGSYKTANMSKSVKIKPDEIKTYYLSKKNKLYFSLILPGKTEPQLLQVLERGKINLYEQIILTTTVPVYNRYGGMMGGSTSSTFWYIAKGTGEIKELKTSDIVFWGKSKSERKNDFGDMLMDNKSVYDKYIQDAQFGFTQIRNLVHLYNTGQPYVDPNAASAPETDNPAASFDPSKNQN
jgi:hypothetical protein